MTFNMPKYNHPNFNTKKLKEAQNCRLEEVKKDGVSPRNYHALSIYPEYFKVNNKWILATNSRMDTVCVVDDTIGKEKLKIVEFRNLKKGDKVAIGRKEDGSEGILVWTEGFIQKNSIEKDSFSFRSGRSRETAYSKDYDNLYDILNYEKENNGYVTFVLGSSVSLDSDSRDGLKRLIKNGYIDAIFCGTETAALDLQYGIFGNTLCESSNYKNLYDTINLVRRYGSIEKLINKNIVKDGFIKACIDHNIDLVIPGTIRDRLGLPETIDNVYKAQDKMRFHAKKTSTVVMLGSILYTIATGNMMPSYNYINNKIRPVYMYNVDIQEFSANKLSDRGTLTSKSIVTNTQDFIRNLDRALNN